MIKSLTYHERTQKMFVLVDYPRLQKIFSIDMNDIKKEPKLVLRVKGEIVTPRLIKKDGQELMIVCYSLASKSEEHPNKIETIDIVTEQRVDCQNLKYRA